MAFSKEEIYEQMADYLVSAFAIPRESIRPEANLRDDLNLDSIDAVDIMVKLQEITGQKVSPDQFESVRTVQDVMDLIGEHEAKV
jgi:acyl carrier protein